MNNNKKRKKRSQTVSKFEPSVFTIFILYYNRLRGITPSIFPRVLLFRQTLLILQAQSLTRRQTTHLLQSEHERPAVVAISPFI